MHQMHRRSGLSAVQPDEFTFAILPYHIDTVASAGRPALVSGSYIWGLPWFSCLVLDGLTSFSVPS
jgi:hypothetical protein